MAILSGYGPPTPTTYGSIGDTYIDLTNCIAYKCVSVDSAVTDYGFIDIRVGRSVAYNWVEGYRELMLQKVNATTEDEVRDALLFAATHPGAFVHITLAEGLNATVPNVAIRNSTIYILGTKVDGVNTNTITFEQTEDTHNMTLQNSSMSIQNVNLLGAHAPTHVTAGYGIIRSHLGSCLYCSGVIFGQTEDSGLFGSNIEAMASSNIYASECVFCVMSTKTNASAVHATANSEVVTYNCSIADDSASPNLARVEKGSKFNQIGTNLPVYLPEGHASLCYVDGVLTTT